VPISSALREIYASAPTTQRFIETLALSHSLFSQVYYITSDNQNWTFLLETGATVTFVAMPFKIVLPTSDGKGNQDLGLTLANIGRELIDPLELAQAKPSEPVKCVRRVYLDTPSTTPADSPLTLLISAANVTKEAVSATATRMDVLNRAFPFNFYRADLYPGLRR